MKKTVLAGLMLLGAMQVQAKEVNNVATYTAIDGRMGSTVIGLSPQLKILKACIDGQIYLITRNKEYATGITPALKNGVPQQCKRIDPPAPDAPTAK